MNRGESIHAGLRVVVGVALAVIAAGMIVAVTELPAESVGVGQAVSERLADSGVKNRVTAVLLNFRAYDTLLEIVVLTLAVVAIWSLRRPPVEMSVAPIGRVLRTTVLLLIPLMLLVGGYLVWAGASRPGGAFQAGAVVAAAGILLLLCNVPALRAPRWRVRAGIVVGGLVFIGAGLVCVAQGRAFLEYSTGRAKMFITVVEVAGGLSIALILVGVFGGSLRVVTDGYGGGREEEA